MTIYKVQKISNYDFSIYHAVYNQKNIFLSYDWNEHLEKFFPNDNGYLVVKDGTAIGGVTINKKHISAPFLIPPFCDELEFWRELLNLLYHSESTLFLDFISNDHSRALNELGAVKKRGQRRMLRPTSKSDVLLSDDFYIAKPAIEDRDEIVKTVYQAHLHGYTTTVDGVPDINDFAEAVDRRFVSFSQTNTLHFGTIIKMKDSNRITAVCLAGIYPDSANHFSTIYQVSVIPQYRRKGLAKAMILNSINTAYKVSPVIGLGVMVGNPAELLYNEIGFISGCEYYDLTYTK